MTAYDTDVLTELVLGNPVYLARAAAIPRADQVVPVVAAGESIRGWLAAVRTAEAGKGRMSLEHAWRMFARSLDELSQLRLLPYTEQADDLFHQWRAAKVRVGSNDLRIAAIAVAHRARLATRNRKDFEQVPGLDLDVWS
jgi:tRNA(fMet)-specific endonuclease VapC